MIDSRAVPPIVTEGLDVVTVDNEIVLNFGTALPSLTPQAARVTAHRLLAAAAASEAA